MSMIFWDLLVVSMCSHWLPVTRLWIVAIGLQAPQELPKELVAVGQRRIGFLGAKQSSYL